MNKFSIIACIVKDYYIDVECSNGKTKKCKVTGDRYVGYFTNVGSDRYFYGAHFTRGKNGYEMTGTLHITRENFLQSVETWTEVF